MAELDADQVWPIAPWGTAYAQWAENDAWWTGNVDALATIYGKQQAAARVTHRVHGEDFSGGVVGAVKSFWWGRPVQAGENRTKLHIPAPADIATLSSDLLFAEPPQFDYPIAEDQTGDVVGKKALARLGQIASSDQALATYAEGGELTAAFGASALVLGWDEQTEDRVWLRPVGADVTVPEFRLGKLVALNLFTEWQDGQIWYRHVERHEVGLIIHTLYQGTETNLGRVVPLQDQPQTAPYAEIAGLTDHGIETGINRLTAAWWANGPARLWRRRGDLAETGRSDFSGGTMSLFDALDSAWSSWMRDLSLGRARLLVDRAYLESAGPGDGGAFDLDREVFTGLEISGLPDKPFVQAEQFAIRVQEHADTTQALYRRILASAGYGELDKETTSVDRTATEINTGTSSRERTRDRKALYAKQALSEILQTAMLLDARQFPTKGGGDFGPVEVTFPPASQQDPLKVAQTISQLRTAQAASIETAVRLANPTWKKSEIDDEVNAIRAERQIADPTRVGSPVTDPDARRQEAERLGLQEGNDDGSQGDTARG